METDTEEPYADAEIDDEEIVDIDEEDAEQEQEDDLDLGLDLGPQSTLQSDAEHRIIRVVPEGERKTNNTISIYELVEAIGIRASQIENGAPPLVDVTGLDDPIAQAEHEFAMRKNPLILRRRISETPKEILVEEWKVREMTFPLS